MAKKVIKKRQIPKISLFSILCDMLIAFLFSYSFLIHFLNWYDRTLSVKIISLTGLTIFLGIIILLFRERFLSRIKESWRKGTIVFTVLLAIVLGAYFGFYYESVPFLTTHQLIVQNVSDGDANGEWKPIEVEKILHLDGDPVPLEDLEISGDHWIAENRIMLKPTSMIRFIRSFTGGVEITLRTGVSQGLVSVTWDGDTQVLDLSSESETPITLSLSPSSWGSPDIGSGILAAISVMADFISIYLIIWCLAILIIGNCLREEKETGNPETRLNFNWVDIFLCLVFLSLSYVLTCNVFGGHFMEYTNLSGDAGNYASFAAAKTYPQLFQNDPLLNDPNNFDYYFTYHIYLTQALASILGNFGSAFMALQLPLTFMQLFGFYLLGKELYQNRLFGILLTSLAFIFTQMNLSEFWGYVTSPIPRLSFQAILPFILLLVLRQGGNVKKWPVIMAIAAASTYVHAVSAPAWSVAIILSLWVLPARSVSIKEKWKYLFVALLVYLIVLLPFVVRYFEKTSFGEQDIYLIEEVYEIIDYRLARGMADFKTATHDFFNGVLLRNWVSIILLGVSLFSMALMNSIVVDTSEKKRVLAVSMWAIGIFLISVLFPMFDFTIADLLERNPLQIQFLRAMRNFFPLLYIFFLWPFAYMYTHARRRNFIPQFGKITSLVICMGFIWLWSSYNGFAETPLIARTISCWRDGEVTCDANDELAERAEFFDAIREKTPEGSRILSDDLAVRYYSLRPLAFSKKDGATFSFSNHTALINWYQYAQVYDKLLPLKDDLDVYIEAYTNFAHLVEADYLVIEQGYTDKVDYPSDLELVFSTDGYSLFSVH